MTILDATSLKSLTSNFARMWYKMTCQEHVFISSTAIFLGNTPSPCTTHRINVVL
jgi:hypothetical protein